MIRSVVCVIAVGIAIQLATSQPLSALDRAFCEGYRDRALLASQDNVRFGCNLTGTRWSPDEDVHFTWCLQVRDREVVQEEENDREKDRRKCRDCGQYAIDAVEAQRENLRLGCGFRGARWSELRAHHRNWCWNVHHLWQTWRAEEAERARALRVCRGF